MGLTSRMAEKFIELSRVHKFRGQLLTLGRQWVLLTVPDMQRLGLSGKRSYHVTRNDWYIQDRAFFSACGFTSVRSIDVSGYEKADYKWDLNYAFDFESDYKPEFDFILDGSTIEHIFHIPNVLKNIHSLLKVNGRALHISPADGFCGDGFYQLSPTFFTDYYRANNWAIEHMELDVEDDVKKTNIVLVRKLVESTCDKMPMQSRYTEKEYWRAGL